MKRKTSMRVGAPRKFNSPEALMIACEEYFQEVDDNPYVLPTGTKSTGEAELKSQPMPRPYLMQGLWRHIGITRTAWADWKANRPELSAVIEQVEQIVVENKLQGATIGIFKEQIVSRDLGLADKREVEAKVDGLSQLISEIQGGND